jgi:hypothetical protein
MLSLLCRINSLIWPNYSLIWSIYFPVPLLGNLSPDLSQTYEFVDVFETVLAAERPIFEKIRSFPCSGAANPHIGRDSGPRVGDA